MLLAFYCPTLTRYLGCDLSLNHGAFVEIDSERQEPRFWFYCSTKKDSKHPCGAALAKLKKEGDLDFHAVSRLAEIRRIAKKAIHTCNPDFIGLEGYAFSLGNRAHQLGELGGVIRLLCWDESIPFRVHDPSTVKLYATGKGNAEKEEMIQAMYEAWLEVNDLYDYRTSLPKTTLEDVADAHAIASMLSIEDCLRRGMTQLSDLPEHRIRAFNRITKANPINLLGRDWITALSVLRGEKTCKLR